jgi:hypothetical protein
MTTFEDLKSQWENQPQKNTPNNGSELIVQKINTIKRKQRIINLVLFVTIGILTSFFFYIEAYKFGLVSFALILMISSLFVRILIEYISLKKLKQINITTNVAVFDKNIIAYYKKYDKNTLCWHTNYHFIVLVLLFYYLLLRRAFQWVFTIILYVQQ